MKKLMAIIVTVSLFGCSGSDTDQNLTFNISGAKGLVLHEAPATASRSDDFLLRSAFATSDETILAAVLESGEIDDSVVTSGDPQIDGFVVSDEKVFLFLGNESLVDDEECRFVSVDTTSNEVACVDNDMADGGLLWIDAQDIGVDPVQVSNDGGIYYMFNDPDADDSVDEMSTIRVLASNGTKVDLYTDNYYSLKRFFVLADDGSVFAITKSNDHDAEAINSILKISSDGSTETVLESDVSMTFLQKFPDGNIYFGDPTTYEIKRYLVNEGSIDSVSWISSDYVDESAGYYECSDFVDETVYDTDNAVYDFANSCGTIVAAFETTSDDSVYALAYAGIDADENQKYIVMQYYPAVSRPETTIVNVRDFDASGTDLVIAGKDSLGENKIVVYDTTSDAEEEILTGYDLTVAQVSAGADGSVVLSALNNETSGYQVVSFNLSDLEAVTFSEISGESVALELFE